MPAGWACEPSFADMTDTVNPQPSVRMRVVYEDLPDLVEVETVVEVGEWRGIGTAYVSPSRLRDQASGLERWCRNPQGEIAVELGANTGIGWTVLRFYTIDMAGHVICHVQIATGDVPVGGRDEQAWRLAVEMPTEPRLVERFARSLSAVSSVNDTAALFGVAR